VNYETINPIPDNNEPQVHLVSVKAKADRAAERHTQLSKMLRLAREQNNGKLIRKREKQLAILERAHGLVSLIAQNVPMQPETLTGKQGPNPAYAPRRKRMRGRSESQREWDVQSMSPMDISEAESRPMGKRAKKAKEPKQNMNMLPMAHNRLADRVYKSPTPEPDTENPLALAAWEARAAMTMASGYIAPPEDSKPILVPSSI